MSSPNKTIGDNKEFGVAAISDVTVYFHTNAGTTSASDTAIVKYFDNNAPRRQFAIRPDQAIQIVSINDVTFTDPITIYDNTTYSETEGNDDHNYDYIMKMVIRTTVVNTNIKIRVRG